jgi:hypothetical protein
MLTNDIIVIIAATEADLLARFRATGITASIPPCPFFLLPSSFSFLLSPFSFLQSLILNPHSSQWSLRPCALRYKKAVA